MEDMKKRFEKMRSLDIISQFLALGAERIGGVLGGVGSLVSDYGCPKLKTSVDLLST